MSLDHQPRIGEYYFGTCPVFRDSTVASLSIISTHFCLEEGAVHSSTVFRDESAITTRFGKFSNAMPSNYTMIGSPHDFNPPNLYRLHFCCGHIAGFLGASPRLTSAGSTPALGGAVVL